MNDVKRPPSVSHAKTGAADTSPVHLWWERLTRFNVRASVAIALLVSVALLPFAMPVADDYCRGALDRNWLDFVPEMYRVWTGRWAAMSFYVLVMPRMNVTSVLYTATICFCYFACAFAWYGVARMVFAEQLGRWNAALLGAALVALYWSEMPAPGETIYWLTGSIEYTVPFAISVFTVWLLVADPTWPRVAAAAMLAVLVPGLQEVASIALIVALGIAVVSAFVLRSPTRPKWTVVCVCAVLGMAINALAPGNSVRLEEGFVGSHPHEVLQTVELTILQVGTYLIPWLVDAKLLAASGLLLLSPWFSAARPSWVAGRIDYWRVAIPLAWLLAVGGIFVALGWAVGSPSSERVYNVTYGVFLIGWLATLFVWSRDVAPASGTDVVGLGRLVASCVLVLALVSSPNVERGVGDFLGEQNVFRFRREMTQRFALIEATKARGGGEVVLAVAPFIPESFFQRDIGPDAQHWRNVCVAKYFGVEKVRIAAPRP